MALTYTPSVAMNTPCPEFKLQSMDEQWYSRADFKDKGLIVAFICNHCPYVQAVEDRIITLNKKALQFNFQTIGICSNDAEGYPEDSYKNLQKRWKQKNYDFIYLHDPSQKVAQAFTAVCTPDFFVYNRKHLLKYRGRLDDSWQDASKVTRQELLDAVKLIANDQVVDFKQYPSMGCSIKWLNE